MAAAYKRAVLHNHPVGAVHVCMQLTHSLKGAW
jgi:hypothetical protein